MMRWMLRTALLSLGLVLLHSAINAQTLNCKLPPYPVDQVPEATSGFRHPLNVPEKRPGYEYPDHTDDIYCKKVYGHNIWVYHPGRDINAKGGDGDLGTPVYAVAAGRVVFAYLNGKKYSAVVIQHNYRGATWYSQYGHVQNIKVTCGQIVNFGDQVAEIGKNGAKSAHLHFEIRNTLHPDPTNGTYFCQQCGGTPCLENLSNVDAWYEDPIPFINSHGPYSNAHANLSIAFSPNPVYSINEVCVDNTPSWDFEAYVTETAGVGIRISNFYWDFYDQQGNYLSTQTNDGFTFGQWFSDCGPGDDHIPAYGQACSSLCLDLGGRRRGYLIMRFEGTDDNGNFVSSASPTLICLDGGGVPDDTPREKFSVPGGQGHAPSP